MIRGPSLVHLATVLVLLMGAAVTATPQARADGQSCTPTNSASTPSAPSPGNPCWTDVTPYPFGSDGNPVDPNSALCARPAAEDGPNWLGDFGQNPNPGNPPCYLQVTSLAFRAWNRGLAATGLPGGIAATSATVGFGVWLFNGNNWFPDPTFPGSSVCPGSIVLWAGKLDYWLIGPSSTGTSETTLCRFDGVNLEWEPLSLPAATLARLTPDPLFPPVGGITSGACYAWNNCWFFGDDGVQVHWDGQSLTDASPGLGASPWLEGDFTGAVAGTDPSGNAFGLAVTKSTMSPGNSPVQSTPDPTAPGGFSPPGRYPLGSQGGRWTPLNYTPPTTTLPNDPYTTDLTAISADSQGDVWVAGDPDPAANVTSTAPAPLERLTENGDAASCPLYGANSFTRQAPNGYIWDGLSSFPDGSALAAGQYGTQAQLPEAHSSDIEPAIVHAACGQTPTVTEFRRPDPLVADPAAAPLIPADYGAYATAVAANAPNDAWAATGAGSWAYHDSNGNQFGGVLRPNLYRWTDGEAPDAPAGDDNESRPSLFTLGPPVYVVGSPTIVVTPVVVTTTTKKQKRKKVKLPPAIYATHTQVQRSPDGTYTLYLTFKVRRPVRIGLEGLQGRKVVASTGLRRFTGHHGELALRLDPKHWPTRLALETPKAAKRS